MSKEKEKLKGEIRNRLLNLKRNSLVFSKNTLRLNMSLSDADYRELNDFSSKVNISQEELNILIQNEREQLQEKLIPKSSIHYKILPEEISIGQHFKIITYDDHGEAIEELINIDTNLFILIGHERGSLIKGDVLKNIISPWNEGGVIDFKIYRNGKRFKYDQNHTIYRTRKVKHFEFIDPQFNYDELFTNSNKH